MDRHILIENAFNYIPGICRKDFQKDRNFELCKAFGNCLDCRYFFDTFEFLKPKERKEKMSLEALDDAPPPMPEYYRKQGETDMVNSPSHYRLKDGKEVIDFIEAFGAGPGFTLGNALKYLARAGKKFADKTDEDRKKADWYVKRLVNETKLPIVAVQTMIDGLLVKMGLKEFYAD